MKIDRGVLAFITLFIVSVFAVSNDLDIAKVASHLSQAQKFINMGKSSASKVSDPSNFKCLLCGIVVNEVEGLIAENLTEVQIEAFIQKDICVHFPASKKPQCDALVNFIPLVIDEIEKKKSIGQICVEQDYCEQPFTVLPDPMSVPTYTINLDLAPEDRWKEVCSNTTYISVMTNLVNALSDFFDNSKILPDLGKTLNLFYFPKEYAEEIRGCASAMNLDYGWVTIINLGYEISDACTSIVAETTSGQIVHARNMDFWDGIWLTDHLKNLTLTADFQKDGKTVYYASTFAGYVGVLSGMKPNGFSISIDTRFYSQGITQFFYEIIAAIKEKNATLVSFLSRDVLAAETTYDAAVVNLSRDLLIADVYYIVAGVSSGQGTVISRNRQNASDIWSLQSPSRWFEVQTNYDHWKQPPWFDDRVKPAEQAMTNIGQSAVTLDTILAQVLSLKPVLNLQSTFTMLACPATGVYQTLMRNCPYPCSE